MSSKVTSRRVQWKEINKSKKELSFGQSLVPSLKMQKQYPSSSSLLSPTASLRDSTTSRSLLFAASLIALLLFFSFSSSFSFPRFSSLHSQPDPFLFPASTRTIFLGGHSSSDPSPPSIAYFISGSAGDLPSVLRLLFAVYHPRNYYLLHLDLAAPQADRASLALTVESIPIFKAAQNVHVIGKADYVYSEGSSSISSTLHGASILLRLSPNWNWFLSLNADCYPLVTQDDLLHILSFLPKDVNFVNHSSYIGWKETRKLKPVIVDPGLYLSERSAMFYATQKRELPDAFQLFRGPSFSILNRNVMEFCILGADNLPRTLLMYFSNTQSAHSSYFPTILCNSRQFNKTVMNDNLLYAISDKPTKEEPRYLVSSDFDHIIQSGAAFATRFKKGDPLMDRIDREMLDRRPGNVVPGGWCLGDPGNGTCLVWGDADVLRPGLGARRLESRVIELLSNATFRSSQCRVE